MTSSPIPLANGAITLDGSLITLDNDANTPDDDVDRGAEPDVYVGDVRVSEKFQFIHISR